MANLMHLAELIFNRPLLVTPKKAHALYSMFATYRKGQQNKWDVESSTGTLLPVKIMEPYRTIRQKVAVIPVIGTLINRDAWIGEGFSSYETIEKQIKSAKFDNKIEAVVFDFDSPGGVVCGCFELSEQIRDLSKKKKTVAFVNGMACSAAYALASATSEIVSTPSSYVGSIGVLSMHYDFSRFLDMEGITPTYVFAGAHKIDGNSTEPLPDNVKDDMQKEVDYYYEKFLATVEKGRGSRLSIDVARKTEARSFIGQEAVQKGLADRIDTFDNVVASLVRGVTPTALSQEKGIYAMDTNNDPDALGVEGVNKIDNIAELAEAKKEGESIGAKAAYERMNMIASAEAISSNEERLKAALELSIKAPTMSADDVIAFISNNIADATKASPASLAERIAYSPNDPLLGAVDPINQNNNKGRLTRLAMSRKGNNNAG